MCNNYLCMNIYIIISITHYHPKYRIDEMWWGNLCCKCEVVLRTARFSLNASGIHVAVPSLQLLQEIFTDGLLPDSNMRKD